MIRFSTVPKAAPVMGGRRGEGGREGGKEGGRRGGTHYYYC